MSSGARTTMRATGGLERPLLLGLLLANVPEHLRRHLQRLHAAIVGAAGDGEDLGLGRPRAPCGPNPAATTTRSPRSQTAGTARTDRSKTESAVSSAVFAEPRAPRRGRRSGATSPARGSCRRRTRRTSRCARGRACTDSRSRSSVDSRTSRARLRQQAAIDTRRDRPTRPGLGQHELRRVEQLDREACGPLSSGRSRKPYPRRAAARRPVAHAVRTVLLEERHAASRRCPSTSTSSCDRDRAPSPRSPRSSTATSPCSYSARSIVEKSHVRMMSCACGRTSIGNTRAKRSGSSIQPPAICGESDDVAQVSMMSGSPENPPGRSRCSAV